MFRRILKIPPSEITDRDIKLLVSALDTSGQGILQPDELLEFINSDGETLPIVAIEWVLSGSLGMSDRG